MLLEDYPLLYDKSRIYLNSDRTMLYISLLIQKQLTNSDGKIDNLNNHFKVIEIKQYYGTCENSIQGSIFIR
jgi:hypothetical protein